MVRLTIVGGAVTNDVGDVLKSRGEDCGGGEGEEGSAFQLESRCVPASVPVKMLLTLLAPALSSVLSLTRSWCLQTAPTETKTMGMAVSLPHTVAVAVNPETQTSELIVVESPDAPIQMIKNSSCVHANYCSLKLVTPPVLYLILLVPSSQPQQPQ